MTYEEAIFYIEQSEFPRERYGLEKLEQVLEQMGNPQNKVKFVHVAGTNGKGSCSAMLACILTQAGYRTGLFTSPHLMRYNERMKINGQDISDQDLIEDIVAVKEICDKMGAAPIVFEVLTLAAFRYFARKKCDIVVLEVGIGGRLDATNCIPTPQAAIITQLGFDHTETLGNTIESISREKGGIIKPGTKVVMAQQSSEAVCVIQNICKEQGAKLSVSGIDRFSDIFSDMHGHHVKDLEYGELFIPLVGEHQLHNAANVLEAVTFLREQGYNISNQTVQTGLAKTSWAARFERLAEKPDFILDGGHNPQCVGAAISALKKFYPHQKIVFILGMMQDKDTEGMLEQLIPLAKSFVCVTASSPRAMTAQKLCQTLKNKGGDRAIVADGIKQAISLAKQEAGTDGVVCALGSLYMAGEIRADFGKK